ncbi:MAG: TRAP transporter small permease [Yaniella sp.]|uniref:TRAP transporter small permease n=1 Tax=Yaniella sp. TaxID=2773929 RepID=UPI003F9E6133
MEHAVEPFDIMGKRPRPRGLKALQKFEEFLGAGLILFILVLLSIQVFQRYLPVATSPWIGELSRYSLLALTFLMVGSLVGQGRHVSIDVILKVGTEKTRRLVVIISSAIVAMCCAAFAQESFALVTADTEQALAITGIPMWLLYVIPLVAFTSATIQALFNIVYAPEENLEPAEEPSDVELETQP